MKPSALIPLITLLGPLTLCAGTTTQPSFATALASQPGAAPEWSVRVALYGWATALDGDVTVRAANAPVDVGFDDVLDTLDFAAMGVVEVGCGKWGFVADLFYAELGIDTTRNSSTIDIEMTQFIGNFTAAYTLLDTASTRFDVYAGARVNSMDIELDIDSGRIGAVSRSAGKTWVDPIIGCRFQQNLSEKFFFRALADIGGFGVSSDFTWQAVGLVGYRVTDSASVVLGYRGLGSDYTDGNFRYDVISHGAVIGYEYKF